MVRPSVPAPGAEPRSEPAEPETRRNRPEAPCPAPASPYPAPDSGRPDPHFPCPPPARPSLLGPRLGPRAPEQVQVRLPHLSPTRAHPAGWPWHEETPRRTGELGTGWGAYGDPVAVGSSDPLPSGSPKRKADQLELQFPSAASLGCLSLGDGGCSPLSGGAALGGGRGRRSGKSSG